MSGPIFVKQGDRLDDVLRQLKWRSAPSVIENRQRIYDEENLLVNVMSNDECWFLLEERGLVRRVGRSA